MQAGPTPRGAVVSRSRGRSGVCRGLDRSGTELHPGLRTPGDDHRGRASERSRTSAPTSVQLAQALTAALNAHDIDTLVGLFTDEHPRPNHHC